MTTHRQTRCTHCGDLYFFQGSGHGCGAPTNDSKLCSGCKGAVNAALAAVPRKFEGRWRATKEMPERFEGVTINRCLEWERAWLLEDEAAHRVPIRRIWPGLINMTTGINQRIRLVRGRDGFASWSFRVSSWNYTISNCKYLHDDFEIEVEWEWDIQKGEYTTNAWTS